MSVLMVVLMVLIEELVVFCSKGKMTRMYYSQSILRAPIFEDFENFLLTSKILSSSFWLLITIVAQPICLYVNLENFITKISTLKI